MVQSRTTRCAFQSPSLTRRTAVQAVVIAYVDERGPIPDGGRPSSSRIDFAPPMCALPHSTPDSGGPMSRFSGASPNVQGRSLNGEVMGKLEGKVAVITGGSSGMALASAKRFVEEGAYVFITGRRQEAHDEAIKLIGRNGTGVPGDAANLDDLDRLFDTVKREKGRIDVLFASAGPGEGGKLVEITGQPFD